MELVILIVILLIAAFAIQYLPLDAEILRLVRGIIIFAAVLFVILFFLDLLGVVNNPIHLRK